MGRADQKLVIRPLVVGAGGLVGRLLAERLEERHPHTVSATRFELDITDRWRIEAEIERLEPTVVVNAAAESDVDACERDPEHAFAVNAEGPAHLAAACRNARIRLVHLSTDYVFGGDAERREEYDEADPPAPLSVYGETKRRGEDAVLAELADAVVLRVSLVFGPGRETFVDKVLARARAESGPLPLVEGWATRPTYSRHLVDAIERILTSDVTGLWHFANPPSLTRRALAERVLRLAGEDPSRVVPLDPDALDLPAARPAFSGLSTRRFEARFGAAPPPLDDALRHYLATEGPR